jgi:hypothetical protein
MIALWLRATTLPLGEILKKFFDIDTSTQSVVTEVEWVENKNIFPRKTLSRGKASGGGE